MARQIRLICVFSINNGAVHTFNNTMLQERCDYVIINHSRSKLMSVLEWRTNTKLECTNKAYRPHSHFNKYSHNLIKYLPLLKADLDRRHFCSGVADVCMSSSSSSVWWWRRGGHYVLEELRFGAGRREEMLMTGVEGTAWTVWSRHLPTNRAFVCQMSKITRKANTDEMGQDKDNTHIVEQNAPNTVRYLQKQSEGKKSTRGGNAPKLLFGTWYQKSTQVQ